MEFLGKQIVALGLALVAVGGLIWLASKVPGLRIGRLPGDISFSRGGASFYFPIVTCLLISGLLSLIMFLLRIFRR